MKNDTASEFDVQVPADANIGTKPKPPITACLFWWGVLRGWYGRLGYGAAVFYVFATALHSGGLGALLTFAP